MIKNNKIYHIISNTSDVVTLIDLDAEDNTKNTSHYGVFFNPRKK